MMRSLYSGISGLKIHQTKMDVIANNISNVNTIGFKSSRVTFSDFFSQSVSGASGANEQSGRGGTNPMQIGLGANVASIDINMNNGMGQRTDNNFDLMIDGAGFFVVGDNSGTFFTRAGAFTKDAAGNLVTSTGLNVMGWDVNDDGEPVRDLVRPIQIAGDKVYSPPQATSSIELNGNINSSTLDDVVTTMQMFDSLGNSYTYNIRYTYAGTTTTGTPPSSFTHWNMQVGDRVFPNGEESEAKTLTAAANGALTIDAASNPTGAMTYQNVGVFTFDSDGNIVETASGVVDPAATVTPPAVPTPTTAKSSIDFKISFTNAPTGLAAATFGDAGLVTTDFASLTQFAQTTTASTERLNGYKAGELSELNVGLDGSIVGTYSNGQTRVIYKIPVATFANPAGLSKAGGNLFQQTINSGTFDGIGVDITSAGGSMSGGVLEMSNVDLSSEFTEMITTQRGFQANSRTITTSDEMLQELVNLKR